MFVSQGIALVALPFVLQAAHGYSVLESALVFTPWPIAVALCAPIAGRLVYRLNATQVSSAGVFMFCLGLGSLMLLPEHATITDLVWRIALCGMGYGFFLPPNNKEMFANAARNRTGTASGVLSTARPRPVHRRGPGRRRDRADGRHRRRRGRVVCHICVRPGLCDRGAVAGRQPGAGVSAADGAQ